MPLKVLSNAYVILNRFILRAKVFLHDNYLVIKPLPKIGCVLTSVKGALSKKEAELLIKSTLSTSEIAINRDDVQGMEYTTLRKNRKDIAELFNIKEVKGNIYRVTIRYSVDNFVRLILPQNEFMKLKNYLSKCK
ncbi:MAG: hypothetical protein DRO14_01650 [Thermoprotei archaeon]|nr:MAG: hypothetical protein DRO14_01650 [Thermoprotei archaeon]